MNNTTVKCMKKWSLLILVLGSILTVGAADRATLSIGSSYLIDNKNVTLIRADVTDDVAIFCVNGVKSVVGKNRYKVVNDVGIDLFSVKSNQLGADLIYKCDDGCECIDCDNSACFKQNEDGLVLEEEIIEASDTDGFRDVVTELGTEENIEPVNVESGGVIMAVLIIIVLILGLVVLWRKD